MTRLMCGSKIAFLLLVVLLAAMPTSALADIQHSTGHFTIDIPDGWIQRNTDSFTYFYGEEYASASGGMLGVREISYPKTADSAEIQAAYKSFADAVVTSEDSLGEISRESIKVDGSNDAILVCYIQELNGKPEVCLSFLYFANGALFQAIYVNTTSDSDRDEFVNFAETLHYQAEIPVAVHHFGSKYVAVTDWKIIEQLGSTCLLVEYEWYHTEAEPIAFMYSFSTEVYQDGVQCYPYIWFDGDTKDTLKIQKNTKLTCYEVFLLNNATSPVTLHIDEIFDFSDRYEKAVYKFDIAR